jgi:NAD(P)-dependent dehydrogenase (short-subunit alcohol dehydrogenase family)
MPLEGKVAVVAGATRGAGRGIAVALGEAGATVICTGRSSVRGNAGSDLDAQQVSDLASRLRSDYERIDVLVNDIWGAEVLKGGPDRWNTPIWEHDLQSGLRIVRLGVETHLVTSHYLLPLLIEQPGGLLVEITDGTKDYNATHYRISVFYDLVKVAVNRLAYSQGHELASVGGSAVAVTPGWLRSEMMLDNFGVTEADWRDALAPNRTDGYPSAPEGFAHSESPRFVGRGIAAMAADPDRGRWNQRSVTAIELARAYGVTDVDGSQPDAWTYTH